ncbi:MAG: GH3 auxin-responsive promoter family protein [Candidatus Brocadiia bacterium]
MNPIAWLVRIALWRRMRQVEHALREPARTQERLLLRMVRRARDTEWGRAHGYAAIRSVADFQRAVPICRYEDAAPLWHRAFEGGRDLAWPGHVPYFALSSGTTRGECKALPVSRAMVRANVRAGQTLLALCRRQAPQADLLGGKTLYLGGSTRLERRGACWQGDSSGIQAAHLPRLAWRYRLPEPDVAALDDWGARCQAICERYLDSPVRAVAGLPSWTLLFFRRLVDTARERRSGQVATVADVWPGLEVFIHFGMAFEPYRRQFKELVGRPLATIDTYSSSEGGLNAIQSDPADPSMQLEVDAGAFYEFVPFRELDGPQPTRLTLDQVETDTDYALLLSTVSGIWAYDVGDIVRFTSLRPPRIRVAGRTRLALNAFGEHVIQEELEHAASQACAALGAQLREFTVATEPATAEEPRGRHLWLVEFHGPAPDLGAFAQRLDAELAEQNLDYRIHRKGDLAMRPPRLVALAPGAFYRWARRHGQLGGQHKIPRVAPSAEMAGELQQLSKTIERA